MVVFFVLRYETAEATGAARTDLGGSDVRLAITNGFGAANANAAGASDLSTVYAVTHLDVRILSEDGGSFDYDSGTMVDLQLQLNGTSTVDGLDDAALDNTPLLLGDEDGDTTDTTIQRITDGGQGTGGAGAAAASSSEGDDGTSGSGSWSVAWLYHRLGRLAVTV